MKHLFFLVLLVFQFMQVAASTVVDVSQKDDTTAQSSQCGGEFGNEFEIVTTQLSQTELWINAKKWISSSFKDYKHTVDMEDKESGTIILKFSSSNIAGNVYVDYVLNATLKIDIRNNKFRYTFSDVTYQLEPSALVSQSNFSNWSRVILEDAKVHLEAARIISRKNAVDSSLKHDVTYYNNLLDITKKYKNEKDEKKDKVTIEYKKAAALYKIIHSIEIGYSIMRKNIGKSLQEAMNFKDNF